MCIRERGGEVSRRKRGEGGEEGEGEAGLALISELGVLNSSIGGLVDNSRSGSEVD